VGRHFWAGAAAVAALLAVTGGLTGAAAQMTLFRHEDQAQRHCPSDTVIWLDFKKRRYYLVGQKYYAEGRHGSFVCREEARRSGYRRSLLGFR
jgi:hypothetical protein